MTRRRRSVESGFSRKSIPPKRVARTAASIRAWPLILTTGRSLPDCPTHRDAAPAPGPGGSCDDTPPPLSRALAPRREAPPVAPEEGTLLLGGARFGDATGQRIADELARDQGDVVGVLPEQDMDGGWR